MQNVTVNNISGVIHVRKNNPPGKKDTYTREGGLATHELIYRLSGAVRTDIDGVILQHTEGALEFLPKGYGSQKYIAQTIRTGECIDIFFDTDVPLFDTAVCIDTSSSPKLKELFTKINKAWIKKDSGYYYKALSILYEILFHLHRYCENSIAENPHYEKIKPAIDYLNACFCRLDIDYEYAAQLCGISYSYFRRLFLQCMGVSSVKYVTDKKIEYAKELLSSRLYNISETADIVGFKDVYYFSHVFKKMTGYAPSKFI